MLQLILYTKMENVKTKKKNNERVIYKKEKIMNQEKEELLKLLKE